MKISKFLPVFTLLFLSQITAIVAQNTPIGYWRAHLPYNSGLGVATNGNTLYNICNQEFYTYNSLTGDMTPYSKVDGMSDVGMACVAYDAATQTVVLAYQNSNIDLFKDNTFYNIPDLKIKAVAGSKYINNIYTENGMAYLSTDVGIVVVDLTNQLINETYHFTANSQEIPIKDFCSVGNYFYAATPNGLYRADKAYSDRLQDFAYWQQVDNAHSYTNLATTGGKLFAATASSVYVYDTGTLTDVYDAPVIAHNHVTINNIDSVSDGIWISAYKDSTYNGMIYKLATSSYHVTDSLNINGNPAQVAQTLDGSVWIADKFNGLLKRTSSTQTGPFVPNGPLDPNNFDIYAYNKDVWIAHGGYNDKWIPNGNPDGISNYKDGTWTTYKQYSYAPFSDSMRSFVTILKDQTDGTVYAASFQDGLFILKQDGAYQILKQNSPLESSVANPGWYQLLGLGLDHEDNLWVTQYGSPHELAVRTTDGNWYKFRVSLNRPTSYPNPAGQLIIDDNDQIWYTCPTGGGVVVYNPNGTPSDPSDDSYRLLQNGAGYGNLPDNITYCLAKDHNDDIWIGTANGIGIVNCASSITQQPCDADIPIVQYDQYAGYLFAGENVHTIAVDGADRKWVGTDNGVWLLSPDASKIVYRFTADNSPLPSNHIQKISIDPVTGDVYIGTDNGLVSYHSTATEGTDAINKSDVLVYPNPIQSGYTGTIAIKGLTTDADVRITDVTGQLVYRTTALGGQAVWNGKDYTGHRPSSGVYLIFTSNKDGSQTYVGKMVFLQ